jgi:molybdopterin biosynthesis enzyme
VGTLLYVIPAIDKLESRREPTLSWIRAKLAKAVNAGPRTHFMTARLDVSGSELVAHPIPRQGSHRISTLNDANALIRVEADSSLGEGEEVPTLPWAALLS